MKRSGETPKARRARFLAKTTAAQMNAATADTPEIKQTWLDIANTWRALAEQDHRARGSKEQP